MDNRHGLSLNQRITFSTKFGKTSAIEFGAESMFPIGSFYASLAW